MARFRFSLETVLKHREDIEQHERDELMLRVSRFQLEVQALEELKCRYRQIRKELVQKQTENPIHEELTCFFLYIQRLDDEMKASAKRLAELEALVQAQKEIVIEASKKRKTLSAMRSKQEKEFLVEVEKREQNEIDDLVVIRYAGRESGSGNQKEAAPIRRRPDHD